MELNVIEIMSTFGVGALASTLIGYIINKRKVRAEGVGAEIQNKVHEYESLLKRIKDQDEMINLLSTELKSTQRELTTLDLAFNKEVREMKNEINTKQAVIEEVEKRHKEKVLELKSKLDEMGKRIIELEEENKKLRIENAKFKKND